MTAEAETALDPEYVEARRVLLDALDALGEHRGAAVIAGAQAIYLRAGATELPIADLTTDADLALDPALLDPAPDLEGMLKAAGFEHVERGGTLEPGSWRMSTTLRGKAVKIPLDLMVPVGVAGKGRRSAELGPHGRRAARRSAGLEAALVDNRLMRIDALDPNDGRCTSARVAGLPALLIAKAYKIFDRTAAGIDDRTSDKDASDVVRIMQALTPRPMATALAKLRDHQAAGESTSGGISHFEDLFAHRNGDGIAMAIRALREAMPEERVRAICLAYAGELLPSPAVDALRRRRIAGVRRLLRTAASSENSTTAPGTRRFTAWTICRMVSAPCRAVAAEPSSGTA